MTAGARDVRGPNPVGDANRGQLAFPHCGEIRLHLPCYEGFSILGLRAQPSRNTKQRQRQNRVCDRRLIFHVTVRNGERNDPEGRMRAASRTNETGLDGAAQGTGRVHG